MHYLKSLALPSIVAIVSFFALAVLELLAVQQYFSGGPGQKLGELLWTTALSKYTFNAMMVPVALWAGYRAASIGGPWVVGVSSGAILTAVVAIFCILMFLLDRGAAEVRELFDGPPISLIWLLVHAVVAGIIGAYFKEGRKTAT